MLINGSSFVNGCTITFHDPHSVPYVRTPTFVSSSRLSYSFNNQSDVGIWTVVVTNPDGKTSNPWSFQVTPVATPTPTPSASAPTISGLSPLTYPASNAGQAMLINGSSFVNGCTITFHDPHSVPYVRTPTFVSSSRLSYSFNNQSDVGIWTVVVTNPDGKTSNPWSFQVTPVATPTPTPSASAPTISGLSPLTYPASNAGQAMLINGSSFVNGCTITFHDPHSVPYVRTPTFVSSSRLSYSFNNQSDVGIWTVVVTNPDGKTSNPWSFQVTPVATPTPTPSASAPTISGLSPLTYPASNAGQAMLINGSSFVNGCTITFHDPHSVPYVRTPTFVSSSRLSYSFNNQSDVGIWTVVVTNPDGKTSNPWSFQVTPVATPTPTPSASAPTISGLSPLTYPASNAGQAMLINGSSFVNGCTITFHDPHSVPYVRTPTFVSSSRLSYSFNNQSDVGIWTVVVTNPDGKTSNPWSFQVTPVATPTPTPSASAPTISGLSPLTYPASNAGQAMLINGSSFVNGCTITFHDPHSVPYVRTPTFVSSSRLSYSFNNQSDVGIWTVVVTNPDGKTSNPWSFQVTPVGSPLTITTTVLNPSTATVGVGYAASQPVAATGGQTPYTWSASGLPNGMGINGTTGAVFGTPTVAGTFNFTVTVRDSSSLQQTASKVLAITVTQPGACYTLAVSSSPSAGGTVTASARNCTQGYTSGTGLTLSASPASGWIFGSWSGLGGTFASNSSRATTFTITGNATVVASFTQGPGAPVAAFSYSPTSPSPGQPVNFIDTSSGLPTSWSWDFTGDGVVDSTLQNPSYTFISAGPFQVTLEARNAYGTSRLTKPVNVAAPAGTPSVTKVTRQYPGVFLTGGNFTNRFDVSVDWQGNPGKVTFSVNGKPPVTETGTATGAPHVFNMATDFPVQWNASSITITATNAEGVSSAPATEAVYVFPYPPWLSSLLDRQGGTVKVEATGTDVLTTFAIDYPQPHRKALLADVPWYVPVLGNHPLGIVDEHTSGMFSLSSRQGSGRMVLVGTGVETAALVDFHYTDVELGGTFSLHAPQGLRLETGYYRSGGGATVAAESSLAEFIPGWDQLKVGLNLPVVGQWLRGLDDSFKLRIPLTVREGSIVNLSQDTAGDLVASGGNRRTVDVSLGALLKVSCVPFVVNCKAWAGGGIDAVGPWSGVGFDSATVGVEAGLAVESAVGFFASGCVWTWVGCSWSQSAGFSCANNDLNFEEDCTKRYSRYELGGTSIEAHIDGVWQGSGRDEGRLVVRRDYARYGQYSAQATRAARTSASAAGSVDASTSDQLLLTNVFPNAAPTITELPEGELVLLGYQRRELPVVQSTELAWSLGTAAGWTPLEFATHDTQADNFPVAASDGTGRVVAAWLRVKDPEFSSPINSAADMQNFLTRYEVVSSILDPKTKAFGPLQWLTNDAGADYALQMSATATGAMMLSWLSNPIGVTFSSSESPARLRCAFWDGNAWGPVADVATGLVGVYGYAAAFRGDRGVVVLARDAAPSDVRAGILDVFEWDGLRWRLASTFGGDGSDNRSPAVAYDARGQAQVVWLRDMDLVWSTLPNPTLVTLRTGSRSLEFLGLKLLASNESNLALIWAEEQESNSGELHARLFDPATQSWSSDIALNDHPFVAHDFAGHFGKDGVLRVVYLATSEERKDVTLTTGGVVTTIYGVPQEGGTDLHLLKHSLVVDLAVSDQDLQLVPELPRVGDTVTALVDVHNAGDFPVGTFQVDLYAGNPNAGGELVGTQTIAGPLSAGAEQELSFSFNYPAGGKDIVAVVDPSNTLNEFTMTNNQATVYLTNRPPLAKVVANVTAGVAPLTVAFDASISTDPDGDALSFGWAFADGSVGAAGVAVTHTFSVPGTYRVMLAATDSHGAIGTATVTITVLGVERAIRRKVPRLVSHSGS